MICSRSMASGSRWKIHFWTKATLEVIIVDARNSNAIICDNRVATFSGGSAGRNQECRRQYRLDLVQHQCKPRAYRRCCDASWQLSRVLVVNNRHSVIRERSQRQEGLHPSKRGHQSNGGPIQKLCSRSPRPTAPVSRQSRRRGLRVGLPLPPVGGGSVGCVQNGVP